jgi:hypothetical protein
VQSGKAGARLDRDLEARLGQACHEPRYQCHPPLSGSRLSSYGDLHSAAP